MCIPRGVDVNFDILNRGEGTIFSWKSTFVLAEKG